MNVLEIFLVENDFSIGKVDSILFTRNWVRIYLYAKYMLMISFLALQMTLFVKSLARV
jgi:hypothetical protein